jgi:hypothetical protein
VVKFIPKEYYKNGKKSGNHKQCNKCRNDKNKTYKRRRSDSEELTIENNQSDITLNDVDLNLQDDVDNSKVEKINKPIKKYTTP